MGKSNTLQKNNTSGVTGISRSIVNNVPYWVSTNRDPVTGAPKHKYFNVNRLGDEQAKQAAIEHREQTQRSLKHG